MRPRSVLARILSLALLFFGAFLGAQQKPTIALVPPPAGMGVSEQTLKIVTAAISDYISAPNSGFALFDRARTDRLIKEMAPQGDMLDEDDEEGADEILRNLGKRAGVQLVCAIVVGKFDDKVIVGAKLINVSATNETKVVTEPSGNGGDEALNKASVTVIKKLLVNEQARVLAEAITEGLAARKAKAEAEAEAKAKADAEAEAKASAGLGVYSVNKVGSEWHYFKDGKEVPKFHFDGLSIWNYCHQGATFTIQD
jgi:hypothetical protein